MYISPILQNVNRQLMSLQQFANTFTPVAVDNADQIIKDVLDGFVDAFGFFSAFSWSKILEKTKFFKNRQDDKGWAKGTSLFF